MSYPYETFEKDPDEVLDYMVPWSDWLGADTISSVTWIPDSGITVSGAPHAPTNTATTATVWLTGGTLDHNYLVICRITTAGGRIADRTIQINVRNH